jgi:hypothetical protein
MRAVLLPIVEVDSVLDVIASQSEVAHEVKRPSKGKAGLDEECSISNLLGEGEQLLRKFLG